MQLILHPCGWAPVTGVTFDELRNPLGSIALVTDRSGHVAETRQYCAYGRPRGGANGFHPFFPCQMAIRRQTITMCRNIKTLFNFEPPATDDEIRAAALQFVRKVSGFTKPAQANAAAFETAVDEIAAATHNLLAALHTTADPKSREEEAIKARARSAKRFAPRTA
ncbi:MAG: DUF2277 domain-containing protein [Caldilineaceae bacterium]